MITGRPPSPIGLLPCLLLVAVWFLLPLPRIMHSPEMDPEARQAAIQALHKTSRFNHGSHRYKIARSQDGMLVRSESGDVDVDADLDGTLVEHYNADTAMRHGSNSVRRRGRTTGTR